MVPATAYSSNVLNLEGFGGGLAEGPSIRGLGPKDYLPIPETGCLATMFSTMANPLLLDMSSPETGRFEAISALASLNISLNGTPVLLLCIPDYSDPQSDADESRCVLAKDQAFRDYQLTRLQARPGAAPDDLEPLPSWLRQSSGPARSAVLGLFGLWAHAFLSGFYLGGIDWFCRHGTDLDEALRSDWRALISALEGVAKGE
jgi:hypothetical protein